MNVYILLDRSGSMASLWDEAINSINAYVNKLDKTDNVHIAAFDSLEHTIVREMPVEHYVDISNTEIKPRGGTPLYDSCGNIMSIAEDEGAERTILVVMTDGYENSSKEYNSASIKAKVKAWEDRNWEVIFLGANFDAVESVSGMVGVGFNKTLNFQAGNFMRGMETVSASTMSYSQTGQSINYSVEDKNLINTP